MKLNTKRTFRFFWHQAARYKLILAALIATVAINNIAGMVPPYFYKVFFDTLSANSSNVTAAAGQKLVGIILIILAINGVTWLLWRVFGFITIYFYTRVMANISYDCFEYLHGHCVDFFTSNFTGSLVKRVNRLVGAFDVITDKILFDLFPLAIKITIIFGVLLWIQPVIGIIMFVWTFVFIAFNYWFSLYKLKYDIAGAKADTRVSGALADTITNNANIKFFARLDYELKRYYDIVMDWAVKKNKTWSMGQIAESVQTFLMVILEFLTMYFAIKFWMKGKLTVGDFVWIQSYLLVLFDRLWNFGRVIRDLYERLADAEEMIQILHTPHAIKDAKGAKPISIVSGKVEFKKVSFTYPNGEKVIKALDFKIKSGEKVAIIGPSGGGKSTITKLLLRLYDIQKGKITVDGQDVKKVTQDSLRAQISYVPQDPILFHRSLMENIRYGRIEAKDEEVIAAAKLAFCHEFIGKFKDGYKTYVGERGIKLSGGERQRVAIARAILANAPILVLDEATSSLDSESEMLIQQALSNLMKQKTTIVIAHRLSTVMKMDRIIVIQDGRIAEDGAHAELLSRESGLYKRLWGLQVGGYLAE